MKKFLFSGITRLLPTLGFRERSRTQDCENYGLFPCTFLRLPPDIDYISLGGFMKRYVVSALLVLAASSTGSGQTKDSPVLAALEAELSRSFDHSLHGGSRR